MILQVFGVLCGAVVEDPHRVWPTGFGPGRRFVLGGALSQRGAISAAGPGKLIAAVCAFQS